MNISTAAQDNPALILLQATLRAETVAKSAVPPPSGDTVKISTTAKQLAHAISPP